MCGLVKCMRAPTGTIHPGQVAGHRLNNSHNILHSPGGLMTCENQNKHEGKNIFQIAFIVLSFRVAG